MVKATLGLDPTECSFLMRTVRADAGMQAQCRRESTRDVSKLCAECSLARISRFDVSRFDRSSLGLEMSVWPLRCPFLSVTRPEVKMLFPSDEERRINDESGTGLSTRVAQEL